MTLPRAVLKPRKARPFYARHPWVYAGAIAEVHGQPDDGAEIDLVSHTGNFVARGLYNSRSKIRLRLYSWNPEERLDDDLWRQRIEAAVHLRHEILKLDRPASACRLIFSEGDGLSGCTVDRYDQWLVVQFTSAGLAHRQQQLVSILADILKPRGIYLRNERAMAKLEGFDLPDGLVWGELPTEPVIVEENGIRFHVHLIEGQKTGFYLDQRENRRRVADFAHGRRVLDAFCYTGGFGLYAGCAGAAMVLGVDSSEPALQLATSNAQLNGLTNISFIRDDVFDRLDTLVQAGERFGLVILDPPKFAHRHSAVEEALAGYRRLQTLAVRLLESDGILVTCCCTGRVTMTMLEDLLGQIAESERRDIQILERRGQSADHPVSAACLESNYLKCLICRVL